MYTTLYKVQLYITTFKHRSKPGDFCIHKDLLQELYQSKNIFTSMTKDWRSDGFIDSAWWGELNTEDQQYSYIKHSSNDLKYS